MPTGTARAAGGGAGSAEELETLLAARAFAYDTLKCAFLQEPSREFLTLLLQGEIVRAFPFADGHAAIAQAVERIGAYLEQPDVLSEAGLERLRWDFTRMFIGPGKVPAPPWESLYTDVGRLHFSEETLAVRAAYRKYHLAPEALGREPDDHIGLELDFMHRLCEMARDRAQHADEAGLAEILRDQQAFLEGHLLAWVPEWARDVVKSAESDFYRGMAQLLDASLHVDRAIVAELLAALPSAPSESR